MCMTRKTLTSMRIVRVCSRALAHSAINLRRETFNMLLTHMSQKNGVEVYKLIYGPSGPFGYYGTLSDDSDSAQVRFLRYPQQEGQRGRCPAKHTKS